MRRLWLIGVVVLLAACAAPKRPPSESPAPAPVAPVEPAPAPPPPPIPAPPPAPVSPALSFQSAKVSQGNLVILDLLNLPAGARPVVKVAKLGDQPKPFRTGHGFQAFIGIPAWAEPGSYQVDVTWEGGTLTGQFDVEAKKFTEDRIWVTEQVSNLRYDPRVADDNRKVARARSQSNQTPLWRGPFILPLEGPITTHFGEIRIVNGKPAGWHSGTDFGVPTGTPIKAPERGIVTLAENLVVTGGTIYIDHGLNLFTGYLHLSKIMVKPGQEVRQGEVIGLVGSTGFSTGPHLHWMAVIGHTAVDPFQLLAESPLGVESPDWNLIEP